MDISDEPVPDCGVVYAATGETYITLARRSARSLRQVMPDIEIDLFTDTALDDPVFNRVHPLETSWIRPKMEALRRSRFERTLFLDADTIVLQDVGDLFDLLDRCDLAGCHAMVRPEVLETEQADIPRAFPYLNSGVLLILRSPRMTQLLVDWDEAAQSELASRLKKSRQPVDQFALRRLTFERDLRVLVLPMEYNIRHLEFLDFWSTGFGMPQILHMSFLHRHDPGDPQEPFDAAVIVGPTRAGVLSGSDGPLRRPAVPKPPRGLRRWLRRLRRE